ncbi:Uma2 family endonuclease [Isosphaeraceae bacterium EP7]
MSNATEIVKPLMTVDEFLDLPDDGVDRDLIDGVLHEWPGTPVTYRSIAHSVAEADFATSLNLWLRTQHRPCGLIVSGEAGFRLRRDPAVVVGIDVAYVGPEVVERSQGQRIFDGPPILAVEILSPSDTSERVANKVTLCLEAGVALVWLVDPKFRTVTVYGPEIPPRLFNIRDELTAEAHLPGLRLDVVDLFPDA